MGSDQAIAYARNFSRRHIAIDGPAASGKTSAGRIVAMRLGYGFLDTGTLYRMCAYVVHTDGLAVGDVASIRRRLGERGIELVDGSRVFEGGGFIRDHLGQRVWLRGGKEITEALRTPEIERAAALVSAQADVRRFVTDWVRDTIKPQGQAEPVPYVLVGRDIGSNVVPQSLYKFYVTASLDERQRRRGAEIGESRSESASILAERDRADIERAHNPLVVPEDAVLIDTTGLGLQDVVSCMIAYKLHIDQERWQERDLSRALGENESMLREAARRDKLSEVAYIRRSSEDFGQSLGG